NDQLFSFFEVRGLAISHRPNLTFVAPAPMAAANCVSRDLAGVRIQAYATGRLDSMSERPLLDSRTYFKR
ncbi:hypothetical protein N9L47_11420, partial [Rhodobacteraceae bacterium]|nr:hypothetical protein [Paracoccaceae bacterium]